MARELVGLTLFELDAGRVGLKCGRCGKVLSVSYNDFLSRGGFHLHPYQTDDVLKHVCNPNQVRCEELLVADWSFHTRHRAHPLEPNKT